MNTPTVSVIVPVYNVEKYLRECVDSILCQTYTDFEVLLVDDGSTDSSGHICDDYAGSDKRIKVFHKPNGGVSSARNLGLDNARGKWIIFCDSDDFWRFDDILENLYDKATTSGADILRGEYIPIYVEGNKSDGKTSGKKKHLEDRIVDYTTFLREIVAGEYFIYLCLFKRDTIGNLRFDCGMRYLEDMKFYIQICKPELKYAYDSRAFYAYRKYPESASNQLDEHRICNIFQLSEFTMTYSGRFYKKLSEELYLGGIWHWANNYKKVGDISRLIDIRSLRRRITEQLKEAELQRDPKLKFNHNVILKYLIIRFFLSRRKRKWINPSKQLQ